LAEIYHREFGIINEAKLAKPIPGSKPAYLYFPVQLENSELADELLDAGKKQGIYLEIWPGRQAIGPEGTDLERLQYQIGSCPVAEETALKVVVLPTSPNTREKDARRVAKLIKENVGN
jgi:dTDP-4-amino-4,6-dideoxygalactose transaminase